MSSTLLKKSPHHPKSSVLIKRTFSHLLKWSRTLTESTWRGKNKFSSLTPHAEDRGVRESHGSRRTRELHQAHRLKRLCSRGRCLVLKIWTSQLSLHLLASKWAKCTPSWTLSSWCALQQLKMWLLLVIKDLQLVKNSIQASLAPKMQLPKLTLALIWPKSRAWDLHRVAPFFLRSREANIAKYDPKLLP